MIEKIRDSLLSIQILHFDADRRKVNFTILYTLCNYLGLAHIFHSRPSIIKPWLNWSLMLLTWTEYLSYRTYHL